MSTNTEIVQALFDAYRGGDGDRMASLLADEFVFTSPKDDHIDRATFLRECRLPVAGETPEQRTVLLADVGEGNVVIMYEYTGSTGDKHRNTECLTVRDGQVVETQVFFGGRY